MARQRQNPKHDVFKDIEWYSQVRNMVIYSRAEFHVDIKAIGYDYFWEFQTKPDIIIYCTELEIENRDY